MTNLTKPNPKRWSAEPAPENLGYQTDVVLRVTLPNGGEYCHRYGVLAETPLRPVIQQMDLTLNMLLAQGFDE